MRGQLPASSKSPVIYISSGTPFMSAVKRVRKHLDKSLRDTGAAPKNASLHSRVEALKRRVGSGSKSAGEDGSPAPVVVTVLGTGKAVQKTLSLASWFEQENDCHVSVRTKTLGAVDDVVAGLDSVEDGFEDQSRVRKLSGLEVTIKSK